MSKLWIMSVNDNGDAFVSYSFPQSLFCCALDFSGDRISFGYTSGGYVTSVQRTHNNDGRAIFSGKSDIMQQAWLNDNELFNGCRNGSIWRFDPRSPRTMQLIKEEHAIVSLKLSLLHQSEVYLATVAGKICKYDIRFPKHVALEFCNLLPMNHAFTQLQVHVEPNYESALLCTFGYNAKQEAKIFDNSSGVVLYSNAQLAEASWSDEYGLLAVNRASQEFIHFAL